MHDIMYDAIVIGTGGVGSATLHELARRGAKVLGLDRFPPGHDRGSSHGHSRIIRRSYFEHPDYVPLLNLAWQLWDDLCNVRRSTLLHRTGLIYRGEPDGPVLQGVLRSSTQHGLAIEQLNAVQARERFPGFLFPEECSVLYEADAGYLLVEDCVTAFLAEAVRLGATAVHGEAVYRWLATPNGVEVLTDRERYRARQLIITAGCWARDLLFDLNVPLTVLRKHLHWYAAESACYQQSHGCPGFFFEADGGYFYGLPNDGASGMKVAEHSGGTPVDDPLNGSRSEEAPDTARVDAFVRHNLPNTSARRLRHSVCFYTMSPDEHFIVDRHPEYANVTFAAGLSGHGFKFTAALGRILTELALDGTTSVNVDFLSTRRFRIAPC